MSDTSVDICSRALLLIGANAMQSFEDETREAVVCNSLYNMIKEGALSSRLWHFSIEERNFGKLAETPIGDYKYKYQIPTDVLRIKNTSAGLSFEVQGDTILTNNKTLRVTCQINVDDYIMPSFFKKYLVTELAKNLSISLLGDKSKFELFAALAEQDYRTARTSDAQGAPNKSFGDDSFWITLVR